MSIIPTKKEAVFDEIHGIKILDPYRWLEDSNNPDVKDWIKNQNEKAEQVLKSGDFQTFLNESVKNFKVVNFSNPSLINGRYFYTERQPDEDQMVLYVKNGLNGQPNKLVDPNGIKVGNTITMNYWFPCQTGKYLVYGLSEGGDEMATLYILDVDKNKNFSEKITNCRHSTVRWLPDDSGFFYTRNARPGLVPKNEEHLHVKVYFHRLGDNPDNDELIFGEDRPKEDMLGLFPLSPDGRYLAINVSQKWSENEVYIYDRDTRETKTFVTGISSKFSLRFLTDKVLLVTNYKANNSRILWATYNDLYKSVDQWKEFISEKDFAIESSTITKNKILIEYLVGACSKVFIFDYDGNEIGQLPLPKYTSITGISGWQEEEEFFYGIDSFVFPKIVYRYDPSTEQYSEYRRTDNPINPKDYEVKQEWYTSNDGTKVPMFIFHKNGIVLNGVNPAILYGYGGFRNNMTPFFMRNWIPWIERGGIFAIANIRGGGEFGEKWHKDGIKENKQNGFDDFIAAAEHLISEKYTDANHLGIFGGSNGGLLVSAVGVQRPDLFKAVCSKVPLTDMVRFHKFGIAIRWIHEYGNPDVKEDLKRILKWSPYHNVKDSVEYPSFFFTTGLNDSRVDPLHARKMTAMLQGVDGENKVLIYTEMDAGHGPGKPIAKVVESQALVLSFFAQELSL